MRTIFAILFLAVSLFGAECRGLDAFEFARNRAFTLPARIDSFDGIKLAGTVKVSTKNLVRLEPFEFVVDDKTEFPKGFEKTYKSGLFTIVYCRDTNLALWIQRYASAPENYETKAAMDQRMEKQRQKKLPREKQ